MPVFFASDEHWDAVHETTASFQNLLNIPFGSHFATDREVVNYYIGLSFLQNPNNIGGWARGFGNNLAQVNTQTVVGHSAMNGDTQVRHIRELDGVVRLGKNSLAQVLTNLGNVNIEGGTELDVANVIATKPGVHKSRYKFIVLRVLIELHTLH